MKVCSSSFNEIGIPIRYSCTDNCDDNSHLDWIKILEMYNKPIEEILKFYDINEIFISWQYIICRSCTCKLQYGGICVECTNINFNSPFKIMSKGIYSSSDEIIGPNYVSSYRNLVSLNIPLDVFNKSLGAKYNPKFLALNKNLDVKTLIEYKCPKSLIIQNEYIPLIDAERYCYEDIECSINRIDIDLDFMITNKLIGKHPLITDNIIAEHKDLTIIKSSNKIKHKRFKKYMKNILVPQTILKGDYLYNISKLPKVLISIILNYEYYR
jgi:hypothetical protein